MAGARPDRLGLRARGDPRRDGDPARHLHAASVACCPTGSRRATSLSPRTSSVRSLTTVVAGLVLGDPGPDLAPGRRRHRVRDRRCGLPAGHQHARAAARAGRSPGRGQRRDAGDRPAGRDDRPGHRRVRGRPDRGRRRVRRSTRPRSPSRRSPCGSSARVRRPAAPDAAGRAGERRAGPGRDVGRAPRLLDGVPGRAGRSRHALDRHPVDRAQPGLHRADSWSGCRGSSSSTSAATRCRSACSWPRSAPVRWSASSSPGCLPRPRRFGSIVMTLAVLDGRRPGRRSASPRRRSSRASILFVIGTMNGYVNITVIAWVQGRTDPAMLGRTMSFLMLGSVVAAPLSLAVAAVVVDTHATAHVPRRRAPRRRRHAGRDRQRSAASDAISRGQADGDRAGLPCVDDEARPRSRSPATRRRTASSRTTRWPC